MPKTEDKFKTVIDRGESATVIRKGSKAAKDFESNRADTMKFYKDRDKKDAGTPSDLSGKYPRLNNKIERGAANKRGAEKLSDSIKERTKYAKGGKV